MSENHPVYVCFGKLIFSLMKNEKLYMHPHTCGSEVFENEKHNFNRHRIDDACRRDERTCGERIG
jgi:hypothetical protein